MPFDPARYEAAREALLGDLLKTVGLLAMNLPLSADQDPELEASRGYHRDSVTLKALADQIEVVTYRFDFLQYALGREDGLARFGHRRPPDAERN